MREAGRRQVTLLVVGEGELGLHDVVIKARRRGLRMSPCWARACPLSTDSCVGMACLSVVEVTPGMSRSMR